MNINSMKRTKADLYRIDDGLLAGAICRQCRACLCCTTHAEDCTRKPVVDLTHGPNCKWNGTFFAQRYCYCK